MNFLAHILLSGDREGVIMGNFAGDFIKGKLTLERTYTWIPDYLLGLKLHRFIDTYTDTHPIVRDAKKVLSKAYPRVAGVVLDIYFDYFLANHFEEYAEEPLSGFAKKSYDVILRNQEQIPEAMKPMAEAMIRHDWLGHYKEISGIKRSFDGLSRRFSFLNGIEGAENELLRNFPVYEAAFLEFFPLLQAAAKNYISESRLD
jgi:acyl carrier protein phosphodiesterase